jgi:heme exporter protein B
LAFFVVAATLFPLGVGPESATLRQIAPGIMWVCALLSGMLSLGSMYASDYSDGSLEQMLLSGQSMVAVAAVKGMAHWLTTGIPLVVAAPLLGLLFDMQGASIAVLTLTLFLGTPVLSLLGGLGAALTLGLRNGVVLVFIVVLPLCVPVLIFGAGAVSAMDASILPLGHLYLLAALLLLTLAGAPFATAAALRISL